MAREISDLPDLRLRESVASVILHGSLALDDYVPGHSDIDLLVIVDRPLDAATMDQLVYAVVAEQPEAPACVDLRVVTRDVAATPPEPPPMELYVHLDPSAEPKIVSRDPGEADLIVELSLSRERGRALHGVAPREGDRRRSRLLGPASRRRSAGALAGANE